MCDQSLPVICWQRTHGLIYKLPVMKEVVSKQDVYTSPVLTETG